MIVAAQNSATDYGLPGLHQLRARTRGRRQVTIAVLDGPVDIDHPCFAGADLEILGSRPGGCALSADELGHGTHVASVIFGQPGSPLEGIAPHCRGLIVPIFHSQPDGEILPCSQLDLARAVEAAIAAGADIVNISGGQLDTSGEADPLLTRILRDATARGILFVAAAGNDGCRCLHVPAAAPGVLAVGAMDDQGEPLKFSNWGDAYHGEGILAPGKDILGAAPGGGTRRQTGTSTAAPIAAGVLGLLLALYPRLPPSAIRNAVLASAAGCDVRPSFPCERLLAGRLNIPGTLELLEQGAAMELPESAHSSSAELPTAAAAPFGPAAAAPRPATAGIEPSSCGCSGSAGKSEAQLVYALGRLDFEYRNEARRESLEQAGLRDPYDPQALFAFLERRPTDAFSVTWILTQDETPIYAITPAGPFAAEIYTRLREFLREQLTEGVERISLPGFVLGSTQLASGQMVPNVLPELRGMYSWSTGDLVKSLVGPGKGKKGEEAEDRGHHLGAVESFLERIYHELRNLGILPQERALNYAATNAFQASEVFRSAIESGLALDSIFVEKSPICRPGSDCWDVRLTFFSPSRRLEQAKDVFRFTVDVSDVVPVSIGKLRRWQVY